jgi:hypothetical protein
MTSPDASPSKPRRLGLYAPFAVVAIGLIAWTGVWFHLKSEVSRRLYAFAHQAGASGGAFAWSRLTVDGWPFRLDAHLNGLYWGAPKGWALNAPRLEAEASAFTPDHWVIVAPDGLELVQPSGDKVEVAGKTLRASISHPGEHPPTISLEGLGLTFTPAPGAAPYFLTRADEVHLHTLAGPADQGAFYLELDGAQATPASLLGALTHGAPAMLSIDAVFDHARSLAAPSWPAGAAAWAAAGGRLEARTVKLAARGVALDATSAKLSLGPDGRLAGAFDANVRIDDAPAAGRTTLTFDGGRARLGPVDVGPAPRLY